MSAPIEHSHPHSMTSREMIADALLHIDHILPAQGPILNFVHHNTIHGFQHLPFEDALAEVERLTGIEGYLPEQAYRKFYAQGRVSDADIFAALAEKKTWRCEEVFYTFPSQTIYRKTLYRLALLFDFSAITSSQFSWQKQTLNALYTVQNDVPPIVQTRLFSSAQKTQSVIFDLWQTILVKLNLADVALHSEDLLNLTSTQINQWLTNHQLDDENVRDTWSKQANNTLNAHFLSLGDTFTLRGLIAQLSGVDCLQFVQPQLIRLCASALDEGIAAWSLPERHQLGLFGAWRAMLIYDINAQLAQLPTARHIIEQLPDNAMDTIIFHLSAHHIPQEKWAAYLQRLALELPGWAGMINWREHHREYKPENDVKPTLADFLAIRLTLDRLWLDKICQETWCIDARLDKLQTYFEKNIAEFDVRYHFYNGHLPEHLSHQAQELVQFSHCKKSLTSQFQLLADVVWTWQQSPLAEKSASVDAVYTIAWRVFRLCQHLGLNAAQINLLSKTQLRDMLHILDEFTQTERQKIWLVAYERHYREQIFQGLTANYLRGRWYQRENRPSAQVIFCMDDREEGIRRHLEEFVPTIETLGAAGFFGVPMNYKGLDDDSLTPLCPVVVVPAHDVHEVSVFGESIKLAQHHSGRQHLLKWNYVLHQGLRRHLGLSHFIIDALAPLTLVNLLAKSLSPASQHGVLTRLRERISPTPQTQLHFIAPNNSDTATPKHTRLGFTDNEQADRVAAFLRNTGLTYGFSELVVLMGHGSISQNNPHIAAYDCGACSGRHGGPNARLFAAMANRIAVRDLLAQRGIVIPSDTWFIGAEHNTCNENIDWYDLEALPRERINAFTLLQAQLHHAQEMSAHERCRRLASAPKNPTPQRALYHIQERATDFSQARPELGHATNACAIVGRRALTQGAFFDRRAFLISYDPTQDSDGKVLEGILLAVGPVGAGINLEYYFSTVNNERFGCGTKIPHNITGLFAVMEGANSDLRTGLPRQMIEIHEAMRLQIIVEAKTSVLEQIYARQPSLIELIGGGWVHLSAKDPDSDAIFVFERGVGFVRWKRDPSNQPLSMYKKSPDYYQNESEPLPPVLITQP